MTTKPRIFISYARDDDDPNNYGDPSKSFVRKLYNDLILFGFEVWWDRVSMPSRGLTFLQEIRDAITERDWLLLVVGQHAVKSEYVKAEWQYALSINKTVIPLLRGGFGNEDDKEDFKLVPSELSNFNALDFRPHKSYETAFEKLLKNLEGGVQTLAPLLNVPAPPAHYLERQEDLTALKNLVMADLEQPVVVISADKQINVAHGMGGIGKSVIAAGFGRDLAVRRAFRDGIVWITVGTTPSQIELLQQLAVAIEGRPISYTDENTAKQLIQKNLEGKTYLIILDDVWDHKVVEPFRDVIAQTRCRILLTTRKKSIATELNTNEHRVKLLTPKQAVQLLQDWTSLNDSDLAKIAEQVEYLPLALKLAGGRIRQGLSIADWLSKFTEVSRMTAGRKKATDRLESLDASIEISVSEVLGDDEQERLLYHTFGIFGDDVAIPQAVVIKLWRYLRSDLSEFECEEIIDDLVDLALIDRSPDKLITLHDLLHDYTHEKLGTRVTQTHEVLLRAYNPNGKPWYEIPHDGYLYFHLAYHLIQAGQKPELIQLLVGSSEWMQQKYIACLGDTSLVQDLELAWADYADPLTPEQVLDLAQLYTVRQVVNARVNAYGDDMLKTLVYLGRVDEALSHARLRSDYQEQANGLLAIFEIFQSQGQIDTGLLTEAHSIALKIEYTWSRASALRGIALEMAKAGQLESALGVAGGVEDAWSRARALRGIALEMAKAGDERTDSTFTQALGVAGGVEDAGDRASALRGIALEMAKVGQLESALGVASGVEDAGSRASALSGIALEMAKVGDERTESTFTQALGVAGGVEEAGSRASALRGIALEMAKAGQFESALGVAGGVEEAGSRASALRGIALEMAKAGQFESALGVAGGVEDAGSRASALSGIALEMAKVGDERTESTFTQALGVAGGVEDAGSRASALSGIALEMAKVGQFESALGVAGGVEEAGSRASALSGIALEMAKVGQLESALGVAGGVESAGSRARALRGIALEMAKAGDERTESTFTQALGVAGGVESAGSRARALSGIALEMAKVGQLESALGVAGGVESAGSRARALSGIALEMAKVGQFESALGVAGGVEDAGSRASALSGIALEMAKVGDERTESTFTQALGVAGGVEDAGSRARALSGIALEMAKVGDERTESTFTQALGVANGVESAGSRARALSGIALEMAKVGDERTESTFTQALGDNAPNYWRVKLSRLVASNCSGLK